MSLRGLLGELSRRDVQMWAEDERLRWAAPKGAISPLLRAELQERKPELLALLAEGLGGGECRECEHGRGCVDRLRMRLIEVGK